MNPAHLLFITTAAVCIASLSHAAEPSAKVESSTQYDDNGGYEAVTKAEEVDAAGTKKTKTTKVDVDVNSDGLASKKSLESKAVVDPKGLGNKSTHELKSTAKADSDGGYDANTTEKISNADGTNITREKDVEVEIDSKGNVQKTTRVEESIDPTGLMNKTKTVSETKTVNGKVVDQKEEVN